MYKVGDRVKVMKEPAFHKYQYDVGETFTVTKVSERCVYSGGYRCISKENVQKVHNKNLIGGKVL